MDVLIGLGEWAAAFVVVAGIANLAAALILGHTEPRRPI